MRRSGTAQTYRKNKWSCQSEGIKQVKSAAIIHQSAAVTGVGVQQPLASRHSGNGKVLQSVRGDSAGQKKSEQAERSIRPKRNAGEMVR